MSNVTNVILCTSLRDVHCGTVSEVETLMPSRHGPFTLIEHTDSEKNLECGIYVAAFNHLTLDNLKHAIEITKWQRAESVQLLVKGEDDLCFTEIPLWLQEAPFTYPSETSIIAHRTSS